jgi:transglutaminase-like putative cysteine protease
VVYRIRQAPATLLAYQLRDVYLTPRLPESEANISRIESMLADPASAGGQQHLYPFSTLALSLEPADRATLREMVQEITGGASLAPDRFTEEAIAWLQRGRGYSLSVRLTPGVDGDPVIRWLRSGNDGWCEYFAAALLLLAREAGYPARIVTGFRGATVNQYEGFLTVRNRDAHAWVEIYDGEGYWVRADPTPGGGPAGLGEQALAEMLGESGWAAWIDSLRVQWYRRVVNFDQTDQQQLAERMVEGTRAMADEVRAWANQRMEQFKAWLIQPWDYGRIVQWVVVLAVGVMVVTQLRRFRDWLLAALALGGMRFGRTGAAEPLRRKAGYWLRRLQRAGDETPEYRNDAEWKRLQASLPTLRFGPVIDPIQAPALLRDARRWWHSRRQRRLV